MPRYKLIIEYDGTPFAGWQIQATAPTVQGVLTDAVAAFAGERVTVNGAGRTDAGVHAIGQVAHIHLSKEWDTDTVRDALTAHLRPHPVAVVAVERVADDFDARFSAVQRHYLYLIVNRRPDLTLERGRAWRVGRPLDTKAMHAAAVRRDGDNVSIEASARSFLHSQVRSMVGSLVAVGDGRWSGADLSAALAARDRAACAPVAPPDGLYLVRVDY
jgi:tRNA pseudouridine38-40 synthase